MNLIMLVTLLHSSMKHPVLKWTPLLIVLIIIFVGLATPALVIKGVVNCTWREQFFETFGKLKTGREWWHKDRLLLFTINPFWILHYLVNLLNLLLLKHFKTYSKFYNSCILLSFKYLGFFLAEILNFSSIYKLVYYIL